MNKCAILRADADRRAFRRRLERLAARFEWRVPAYTLMTNHYHLLVDTHIDALSEGLRLLNGVYAQQFNETYGRSGHLFQGRSHVWIVRDDEHLENTCEYIWNNAVRAGLCEAAGAWPWNGSI